MAHPRHPPTPTRVLLVLTPLSDGCSYRIASQHVQQYSCRCCPTHHHTITSLWVSGWVLYPSLRYDNAAVPGGGALLRVTAAVRVGSHFQRERHLRLPAPALLFMSHRHTPPNTLLLLLLSADGATPNDKETNKSASMCTGIVCACCTMFSNILLFHGSPEQLTSYSYLPYHTYTHIFGVRTC